jgi:hypothetical protein
LIAYYDATAKDLKVYDCANKECSSGSARFLTTSAGSEDFGRFTDIQRRPGTDEDFVISYYDVSNADMKLLSYSDKSFQGGINLGSSSQYFNSSYVANSYSKTTNINNFDVAEEYEVEDESIQAGDVVRFKQDSNNKLIVERAVGKYDREAIGVISTEPGLYLKDWKADKENGRPVALAGRVPVKVTTENGSIKRGDYLTTSSKAGYAMKATEGGLIIGRAMEDFPTRQGDSELVKQELEATKAEAKELIEQQVESGEIKTEEVRELTQKVEEVTKETTPTTNEGRIMLFVDVNYAGDKLFGQNSITNNALAIKQYDLGTAQGLFKINEAGIELSARLTVNGVLGAQAITSNDASSLVFNLGANQSGFKLLSAKGETAFAVNQNGKLTVQENEASSIGQAILPKSQTEIMVRNSAISDQSIILISPDQFVKYKITKQLVGEGFTITIDKAIDSDTIFDYWIIN